MVIVAAVFPIGAPPVCVSTTAARSSELW